MNRPTASMYSFFEIKYAQSSIVRLTFLLYQCTVIVKYTVTLLVPFSMFKGRFLRVRTVRSELPC